MDSLDLIRAFREVAQRSSFAAAARALDLAPASVSKYVAALEARFGVRLFNRTTRTVTLTDAGHLLYERTGPLLEIVALAQNELLERASRPSGKLTISAPYVLMQTPTPALLGRFLSRYPDVSLQLQITNRLVDLAEEGVDLALRVGPIPDANLVVRRLMRIERSVAATPAYWRKHGKPTHPSELDGHRTLVVAPPDHAPVWEFTDHGKPLTVHLQPLVLATDATPLPALTVHDLGVVYLSRTILEPYLESGTLAEVLADYASHDTWLYAAYAQRRYKSAALTALLAFLEQETQGIKPEFLPEPHAALRQSGTRSKPTRR
jgi:DNA-binding transcriptional LysR family regulator